MMMMKAVLEIMYDVFERGFLFRAKFVGSLN